MKEYTVEKVVKLEERLNNTNEIDPEMDKELLSKAIICLSVGGTALTTMGSGITDPALLPIVVSSAITIYGFSKAKNILSNMCKSHKLRKQLERIYEQMGSEFKQQVEDEISNRAISR